jgi:hypothetical protein
LHRGGAVGRPAAALLGVAVAALHLLGQPQSLEVSRWRRHTCRRHHVLPPPL